MEPLPKHAEWIEGLQPPPELTLSEWAERKMVLSTEYSASRGAFHAFPYQVGIQDAMTDPRNKRVVVMKSARVGYSQCLNNGVGYYVEHDPSPILLVQPRESDAEDHSKRWIAPMLRDVPALAAVVGNPKSRDGSQTILSKQFLTGAGLKLIGADSPGGFRRITVRVVLFDEVDGYAVQGAGSEGDQISLGIKRSEALALDTPIPTPDGWTTIGELRVGDAVFDERGEPCRVEYTTETFIDRECYRVTFSDGATIVADAGHLWSALKRPGRAPEVMTTVDLGAISGKHRRSIPLTRPLRLPEADLPIDPYVLGAWLGDGLSHAPRITSGLHDAAQMSRLLRECGASGEIQDKGRGVGEISLDCRDQPRGWRSRVAGNIHGKLLALGIMRKWNGDGCLKRIPEPYLRGSFEQRLALLQGLNDTDGCIEADPKRASGRCHFATALPEILRGYKELLSSLGIKYWIHERRDFRWKKPSVVWTVWYYATADMPVFRLPRKVARLPHRQLTRTTTRKVVSVECVPSVPVRCIAVSSSSRLFLAGRQMVPTHNTFWNRVIVIGSTPTVKGESRIEKEWLATDMRKYFVPCPHCGTSQVLEWGDEHSVQGIKWRRDENGRYIPGSAYYGCIKGCVIEEHHKEWMIRRGEWRATAEFQGYAGFHIWSAYSLFPNAGWSQLVEEWLRVFKDPLQRQTFVNLVLGLPYEDKGDNPLAEGKLLARCERWPAEVPDQVGLLTAGVDFQADRLEVHVIGWGENEESWSVAYDVIEGDPESPALWAELDRYLLKTFARADGRALEIAASCLDSGGQEGHAQRVYEFSKARLGRRVWAIKGEAARMGQRSPVWPTKRPLRRTKASFRPVIIGVNTAKDVIRTRLHIEQPGPGYMHFPADRDLAFFSQLIAERSVRKESHGQRFRVWELPPGRANEALDTTVYSYAALCGLQHLGLKLNARVEGVRSGRVELPKVLSPAPEPEQAVAAEASAPTVVTVIEKRKRSVGARLARMGR